MWNSWSRSTPVQRVAHASLSQRRQSLAGADVLMASRCCQAGVRSIAWSPLLARLLRWAALLPALCCAPTEHDKRMVRVGHTSVVRTGHTSVVRLTNSIKDAW